jgi:hypothetical protein
VIAVDNAPAIHHLAFRKADAVPICGSADGGELSLAPERIGCEACRRIVGLGPLEVSIP